MFTEVNYMEGKRIRYHRLRKGLTTEQLASMVGCTKAAISLYESDERKPNNEICMKIAKALEVPWVELLSNTNKSLVFNHISFRKKQKASKNDIELLKSDIEKRCESRISIMNILGGLDEKKYFVPKRLSFDDDIEKNAQIIRSSLGFPTSGPLFFITSVLELAGIIVLSFDCAEEIDGINGTVNNIPYIFFNSKIRTIERQRFTLIHEVCHLFFDETKTEKNEKEIEKYINQVAGTVLVPTDDIYSLFGRINRSLNTYIRNEVSKEYRVAPSCLITRLYEAGVITEMYYKKYFMFLNKNGGKKNEKSFLNKDWDSEDPTIFNQQVYLALSQELITASKAAEYLNIPLFDVMQNMKVE